MFFTPKYYYCFRGYSCPHALPVSCAALTNQLPAVYSWIHLQLRAMVQKGWTSAIFQTEESKLHAPLPT